MQNQHSKKERINRMTSELAYKKDNFNLKRCMEVDGGKCVTRNGRQARVICTDKRTSMDYPVISLITYEDEIERTEIHRPNGKSVYDEAYDIFNLPPTKLKRKVKAYRPLHG